MKKNESRNRAFASTEGLERKGPENGISRIKLEKATWGYRSPSDRGRRRSLSKGPRLEEKEVGPRKVGDSSKKNRSKYLRGSSRSPAKGNPGDTNGRKQTKVWHSRTREKIGSSWAVA